MSQKGMKCTLMPLPTNIRDLRRQCLGVSQDPQCMDYCPYQPKRNWPRLEQNNMLWASYIHPTPEQCCGVCWYAHLWRWSTIHQGIEHTLKTTWRLSWAQGRSGRRSPTRSPHTFIMIKVGDFILSSRLGKNKPEREQDETATARASNRKTG